MPDLNRTKEWLYENFSVSTPLLNQEWKKYRFVYEADDTIIKIGLGKLIEAEYDNLTLLSYLGADTPHVSFRPLDEDEKMYICDTKDLDFPITQIMFAEKLTPQIPENPSVAAAVFDHALSKNFIPSTVAFIADVHFSFPRDEKNFDYDNDNWLWDGQNTPIFDAEYGACRYALPSKYLCAEILPIDPREQLKTMYRHNGRDVKHLMPGMETQCGEIIEKLTSPNFPARLKKYGPGLQSKLLEHTQQLQTYLHRFNRICVAA